jgi:hypothetical protein
MSNISIIIPVHEYNDVISSLLDKAFDSIMTQQEISEPPEVLIVFPAGIESGITSHCDAFSRKYQEKGKTVLIRNDGNPDYQSQVNLAVESVKTPYFSVLEFDDEYSRTFIKNADRYVNAYPDVDVFLTMMIEVNEKNEGIKLTNETVWAQQFVGENGEMGYLNLNALKQYTDFKLSGAVIKKSEFENLGRYKSNIRLTFMYEFLLRALNNACKIFSIPRIGYKHLATREDSLFDMYLKKMPVNERKFWFETAIKESNFPSDRTIDMSLLKK